MIKRGLYIGKFQPYTNGHHAFVKEIIKDVDELIFGVSSAQINMDINHPFTAGERILMIAQNVREFGIPTYIIPLEDISNNLVWIAKVKSMMPDFDTVYTSSNSIKGLFSQVKIRSVLPSEFCIHQKLDKMKWLAKVSEGRDWEADVPNGTVEIMREIHGTERIRTLYFANRE